MMIKDAATFVPAKDDMFIFDACILIYLFYTPSDYNKEETGMYKKLFEKVITSKCKILLPTNLLCEFFNRFIKLEYDVCNRNRRQKNLKKLKIKEFRQTPEFEETVKELIDIFEQQLLPYSEISTYNANSNEIISMLNLSVKMDFNDFFYCNLAGNPLVYVITNDNDFSSKKDEIKIITANKSMLTA